MTFRSTAFIGITVAVVASSGGAFAQQVTPKRNYDAEIEAAVGAAFRLEQQMGGK